ncbi:MAG: hypothetical protein IH886_09785 [Nitrospinae bacterium]|nr:hypothetical protein [Nitrospinota bacterium]
MANQKHTGVTPLYYSFLEKIKSEREKFAYLQLIGRIEDYLVKEFIYHIFIKSKGTRYAYPNVGNKGERKYDIAIMNDINNPKITALIEAKYFRNKHRISDNDASDENTTTLRDLSSQMGKFNKPKHSYYSVKLIGHNKEIYGLVFASFVSLEENDKKLNSFFNKILTKASEFKLIYHDHKHPYLNKVYEKTLIKVCGKDVFCTLKAGLWRKAI